MSREIEFRVKTEDGLHYVPSESFSLALHDTGNLLQVWSNDGIIDELPVLSLDQFTGLRDKKGNKIFEGDILIDPLINPVHYENGNYSYGVVDFFNGIFRIGYGHIDKTLYDEIGVAYKQVVIGNLHQNPELLGEKGE
jgi:uncharacterized phage protein (TIGR01671 family)